MSYWLISTPGGLCPWPITAMRDQRNKSREEKKKGYNQINKKQCFKNLCHVLLVTDCSSKPISTVLNPNLTPLG